MITHSKCLVSWSLANILFLNCNPNDTCNDTQTAAFQSWRLAAQKAMQPLRWHASNGVSFDACVVHCQTLANATWNGYATENGLTLRRAVEQWFFEPAAALFNWDGAAYPANPSCAQCHYVYGDRHGCVY